MPTVELTPEEAESLRDVLRSYLSDLHTEISHTDDRDYRANLKEKEALLKGLVERMEEG